jgi:hypothetical protein
VTSICRQKWGIESSHGSLTIKIITIIVPPLNGGLLNLNPTMGLPQTEFLLKRSKNF